MKKAIREMTMNPKTGNILFTFVLLAVVLLTSISTWGQAETGNKSKPAVSTQADIVAQTNCESSAPFEDLRWGDSQIRRRRQFCATCAAQKYHNFVDKISLAIVADGQPVIVEHRYFRFGQTEADRILPSSITLRNSQRLEVWISENGLGRVGRVLVEKNGHQVELKEEQATPGVYLLCHKLQTTGLDVGNFASGSARRFVEIVPSKKGVKSESVTREIKALQVVMKYPHSSSRPGLNPRPDKPNRIFSFHFGSTDEQDSNVSSD